MDIKISEAGVSNGLYKVHYFLISVEMWFYTKIMKIWIDHK